MANNDNNNYKNRKGKIGDRFRKRLIVNSKIKTKKEYTKILVFVALLGILTLGTSYALFTLTVTSNKTTVMRAGHFEINYKDGNRIILEDEVPKTDSQGLDNKSYEFTITNNGDINSSYSVFLEEGTIDAYTLDKKYIRYSVKEDNGTWSTPTNLSNGLVIVPNKTLKPGEKVKYNVVFWLDYNADNSAQGKKFNAKIVVNTLQNNTPSDIKYNAADITINGEKVININRGEEYVDPGILNIKDKNGNELSKDNVEITYEYFDGENVSPTTGVDTSRPGTYIIKYKIIGEDGQIGIETRTINVKDDSINDNAPVISLIGDSSIYIEKNATYVDKGATAIDTEDGDITDNIRVYGSVDTSNLGINELIYYVKDSANNLVSVAREVVVSQKINDDGSIVTDNPVSISVDEKEKKDDRVEVDITLKSGEGRIIGYAVTKGDKDPSEVEFIDVDGDEEITQKINFTENGIYYIWTKDDKGNINKQKIVIEELDKTAPTCVIKAPDYAIVGNNTEINISCYDDIALKDNTIEKSDISFNHDGVTIKNLEQTSENDNSVQYKLTIVSSEEQTVKVTLAPTISDKSDNVNRQKTSNEIEFSKDMAQKELTVDMTTEPTKQIEIYKHVGTLVYNSSNTNIAIVDQEGNVTGVGVGTATVSITDLGNNYTTETTITVNKTLNVTYTANGPGLDEISQTTEQNTMCVVTPRSSGKCKVKMPEFTSRSGYTVIGWNTDKTSHTGTQIGDRIEISDNTILYTIVKKNAYTISVSFDSNGSDNISSNAKSCTIPEVYNDEEQAPSCEITTPSITATADTPIVVGWNSDRTGTNKEFDVNQIVNLTASDNGKVYYAITKNEVKTYSATYEINGFGVDSINELVTDNTTCMIPSTYNGEKQSTSCVVTAPVINVKEGYTAIGWNTDKNSHESLVNENTLLLDGDKKYYTITKLNGKTLTASYVKFGTGVESISSTVDSCETEDVFNPVENVNNTCTISNLPTITVSSGYTALGWDISNTSHSPAYSVGGNITLNNSVTLYSISKKNSITYNAQFNINGAAALSDENGEEVTTNVTRSCTINEVYNEESQNTSCDVIAPKITASSNTPEIVGYNNDLDATIATLGDHETLTLTGNVVYYAITKKSGISLKATFNANGATLSSTDELSCTLLPTYNGVQQDTSCTVTAPTITPSDNTPDVIGYSLERDNHTNNDAYSHNLNKLTLTEENNEKVWYAQTEAKKKTYTVDSFEAGSNVESVSDSSSKSCSIDATYNGIAQLESCSITPPEYTARTGYTKVGWNTSASSIDDATSIIVLNSNVDKFYAHASANSYTIEYYDNTELKGLSAAEVDQNITLTSKDALALSKNGYTFKGWSTDNSQTVSYTDGQTVHNLSTTSGDVIRLYAVWVDDIKPICIFGTALSTTTGSTTTVDLECTDLGSGVVSSNLALNDFTLSNENGSIVSVSNPEEISNGYKYTITLRGESVGKYTLNLKAGVISDNDSNVNESVDSSDIETKGITYTAIFTKGEIGVESITSSSLSCTTTGSATTCKITLPDMNLETGYVGPEWYRGENLVGIPGDDLELSSDLELVSKATRATASIVQYNDTYNMGCTNVQDALDKINEILS